MAKKLIQNYTFSAASKQITFSDYTTIALASVLVITNVTRNIIVYNFADPLFGGTVATNVLTLTLNVTGHSDTDKLQIWYDDGSTARKAVEQIIDWTAVAQNTIVSSGVLDCGLHAASHLAIQAFLDTTTAHSGTRFVVQASSNTTGDEDWCDYTEFVGLIATAVTQNLTNNPANAGTTALTCANTTGFATNAAWRAIKDATLVNSEIFYQKAFTTNTSVTAVDGTTNSHVQNTPMWNTAMTQVIMLAPTVRRVRVLFDNTYSSAGSTLNVKVRINEVTSL
jgi:hypothetical protein